MEREGALVKPRFARGCRCFAVMVDGRIGGYGWLSVAPEWIGELQLEITPGPGEGYVWNCATVHEYRRRGIFRSLLSGISRRARDDGLRRLWIGSVDIPAEKAMRPAGFRPALTFRTLTLVGLHCMMTRQAANEDFSLSYEARAVLGSHGAPLTTGLLIRRRMTKVH